MSKTGQFRQGFTLVEVLVAVIILLIGVVAALRIFPPGFRMFQESNDTTRAVSTMQGQIAEFQNHPESLPDAILPVDYSSPDAAIWVKKFDFNDLQPIDYQGDPDPWLSRLKMPNVGGSNWPLWEPVSVRAMRRIIGERAVVPADLTAKKTVATVSGPVSGSVLTVDNSAGIAIGMTLFLSDVISTTQFVHVASVDSPTQITIIETVNITVATAELSTTVGGSPCYLPRFGPITPNMQWDNASSTFIADPNPVTIYDIRYRTATLEQLQALAAAGTIGNDDFYYAADYTTGTVYFLKPKVATTSIRFIFSVLDLNNANKQVQVAGETRTLPDMNAGPPANQLNFTGMNAPVTTGSDSTGQLFALQFPTWWKLIPGSEQFNRSYTYIQDADPSALNTGQYTVERDSDQTLDVLHFAQADAGRTVKLDYTCTDWNILHEDVAVDPNGYLNLTARNLKVGYLFNFPREPLPWGLTQTLQNDVLKDEVVRLVNLRTGVSYKVTTDAATDPTPLYPKYFLQTKPGVVTSNGPTVVDMSTADGGRIRIGAGPQNAPQWTNFNTVNSTEFSPFTGDTYRVFYRTRQDWTLQTFRAPAQFWYTSDPVNLGWDRYNLAGNVITLPGVYEGQTIAVDYQYAQGIAQGIAQGRVSGEQHLIPARDKTSGLSTVTLNYTPSGAITVRGVSVTVRALWIQQRNTTAKRYSALEPAGIDRTISERWQTKSITVVLPATKE